MTNYAPFFTGKTVAFFLAGCVFLLCLVAGRAYLYMPHYHHPDIGTGPGATMHEQWSPGDLPLVELPASAPSSGNTVAIFLSGDGGWQELDSAVSSQLNHRGIPVVGVDSLRFFWRKRSPTESAKLVEDTIKTYSRQWNKSHVMLIGYSQGADVLPVIFNRLPASVKAMVTDVVLMGVDNSAQFEIHIANWLTADLEHDLPARMQAKAKIIGFFKADDSGLSLAGEMHGLTHVNGLCIYGKSEKNAYCAVQSVLPAVALRGSHHFGADYPKLAGIILDSCKGCVTVRGARL